MNYTLCTVHILILDSIVLMLVSICLISVYKIMRISAAVFSERLNFSRFITSNDTNIIKIHEYTLFTALSVLFSLTNSSFSFV